MIKLGEQTKKNQSSSSETLSSTVFKNEIVSDPRFLKQSTANYNPQIPPQPPLEPINERRFDYDSDSDSGVGEIVRVKIRCIRIAENNIIEFSNNISCKNLICR